TPYSWSSFPDSTCQSVAAAGAHWTCTGTPPTTRGNAMNTMTRSIAAGLLATAIHAALPAQAATPATASAAASVRGSYITTADGVQLYFKDWGPKDGPVVTFSHGWPLNSDSWESQMRFLAGQGYRVIA